MGMIRKWKRKMLTVAAAGAIVVGGLPAATHAAPKPSTSGTNNTVTVPEGVNSNVKDTSVYYGEVSPNATVTVDIIMNVQNKEGLAAYINQTVDPSSNNYHNYLSVGDFKANYGASDATVKTVTDYFNSFGIQTNVYPDNLIITLTGRAKEMNDAFNVVLKNASFHGKKFVGTADKPSLPDRIASNILCVLGLTDYSNFTTNTIKRSATIAPSDATNPEGPLSLKPQDLMKQYNVNPLYQQGATGAGQTIGIVSLADFNTEDAYAFWDQMGINVKPNRITKVNVDGGTDWNGYDETTLDVQQSGALAPQADIRTYLAPNTDAGFVDGFAKAINENQVQSLSVSWGLSETILQIGNAQGWETPEYSESFNELFMEAAAQGISTFAAAGDAGAYDTGRNGIYDLSVDNPADSPYITAAGGTTLPFHFTSASTGVTVQVDNERAWGWDYLANYFKARGLDDSLLTVGGGGGFSKLYATPDYQQGVSGVNTFTAIPEFNISSDFSTVTYDPSAKTTKGTGTGRNMPDLSMNADPYTGYYVYLSDPGKPGHNSGYAVYGGTSFVSPQLNGLTALINSADNTQVGFWNPQIYRFAQQSHSPFNPLNTTGTNNDNDYFTGTPGTVYNQATGLGTPDVAELAKSFNGATNTDTTSSKGHKSN